MEWISVNEKYPQNLQSILVKDKEGVVYSGGFYEGPDSFCLNDKIFDGNCGCMDLDNFTHWMPTP